MKKLLLGALAALTAAACALGATGCGSSQPANNAPANAKDAVVVGTLATEDILPMWVVEQQGGVDGALQVQTFQSATELIAAITAGEVDLAMTDPMVAASIYASGTDVQVEWVTLGTTADQGRFGIMTADGKKYAKLTDLAGVPIGVGSNTILEYVMDTLMTEAGVPEDQIVKEELQKLPVRFETMASGKVAAAALPASLLALGEAKGCTTIADDTKGKNISQSIMIARTEFLESEGGPAILEACKTAWDAAALAINEDPESYRDLLVEKANLSDAVAKTYPICQYPTCQLPTQEQVDDVLAWMEHKGYLTAKITYDAATGTFSGR
ncbi:MAG: PhnD/SsuA/transferrin family substrate-binding protein [Coriobacteriia bacterium]|nr:PhnD/SsuA/transferrin family substrate-binding protein [Coriobacteriia bacterium]